MSDRPYWFECFFLRRDLRDWLGNHFRHLLDGDRRFFLRHRPYWFECSFLRGDLRDRLSNHFRHLLCGDRWFLLRDYLRWRLPREYLRCFPGDHLNRILLCRLFTS